MGYLLQGRDAERFVRTLLAGLALLVVASCSSEGSDSATSSQAEGPEITATPAAPSPATTALPAPTVDAEPAGSATTEPTPEPVPSSDPEPTATSEPESTATSEPEATLLLPGDGWEIAFMHTDVFPPSGPGPFSMSYAGTDAGVWGPVAQASFIPEAGYQWIGNRGTPYHDVVSANGAPVRVRTEFAPRSITAVMAVDDGSVVVTSYDLTEDELLLVVDSVAVNDQGVVEWDSDALPADLTPFDGFVDSMALTQYLLQRGDGESLSLISVPVDHWQMPLLQRTMHAESELTQAGGYPALVYGYDPRSRASAGAVYSDGELFYILEAGPAGPGIPQRSPDEITTILDGLQTVPLADIAGELGFLPRAEVVGEWLTDTPLPADVDLAWMLDGPPVSPEREAFTAHQIFGCAWAKEWIETGDTAALDQIEAAGDWPTALILEQERGAGGLPRSMQFSVEQARELTSADARRTSALALDCSFLIGPVPQEPDTDE